MSNREYWKNIEKQHFEARDKALKDIRVEWLDRELFWTIFEENQKESLGAIETIECNYHTLRTKIATDPVYRPFEEDFPGPVERWYGRLMGQCFLLTYYYGTPEYFRICANDRALKNIVDEIEKLLAVKF